MSSVLEVLCRYSSLLAMMDDDSSEHALYRHTSAMCDFEDTLPSYTDAISAYKSASVLALQSVDSWFKEPALPPLAQYIVRSDREPSFWQLLSGPMLSNAVTPYNDSPRRKRRYRVLYPPDKYEDVYLHKNAWATNTSSLPQFHVELYGCERYELEPIFILGPIDFDAPEAIQNIAAGYAPGILFRVEAHVAKTSRFVSFCENEYFSWDWRCKTVGAIQDMKRLILAGKRNCTESASLVIKLEQYLEFVGKTDCHEEAVVSLRRRVAEARFRLKRLNL